MVLGSIGQLETVHFKSRFDRRDGSEYDDRKRKAIPNECR